MWVDRLPFILFAMYLLFVFFFFFFQAEDGIRDYKVTGVQTCALPISHRRADHHVAFAMIRGMADGPDHREGDMMVGSSVGRLAITVGLVLLEIGRASCRGRGEISVVAVSLKKKKKKRWREGVYGMKNK